MKTKEVVLSLRRNQNLARMIPEWANAAIPIPFFRGKEPCLAVFFYPLKMEADKRRHVCEPVVRMEISVSDGRLRLMEQAPFSGVSARLGQGCYPNAFLRSKSVAEGDALYDRYYEDCDKYLATHDLGSLVESCQAVREEGLEDYFKVYAKWIPESGKAAASAPIDAEAVLSRAKGFFEKAGFTDLSAELNRLRQTSRRQAFNVAVVGEFSRGKSTLVNALIGEGISLPVGDLPTTAVLTRIVPGREGSARFVGKGIEKKLDFTAEAFEAYLADPDGHDPEGLLDIRCPMPWCGSAEVAIFDTPGVGDAVGSRAQIARQTISYADCTIVCVSAQAACSLTEMQFLQQHILLKKVPNVAVYVSRLDCVPPAERARVLRFVQTKVAQVSEKVRVWVGDVELPERPDFVSAAGVDEIRTQILQMAADPSVLDARTRHLLQNVLALVDSAENRFKMREQASSLDVEKGRQVVEQLKERRKDIEMKLGMLQIEVDKARLNTEKAVGDEVRKLRIAFSDDIMMALKQCPEPKEWLKTGFPYAIRKHFRVFSERMEQMVQGTALATQAKLSEYLREKCSLPDFKLPAPEFGSLEDTDWASVKLSDIDKMKMRMRCLQIGLPLTAVLLGLGPVALPLGGAVAVGGEMFLKKSVAQQKKDVEVLVLAKLDEMLTALEETTCEYAGKCFAGMASAVTRSLDAWLAESIAEIAKAENARTTGSSETEALERECGEIKQTLETSLN